MNEKTNIQIKEAFDWLYLNKRSLTAGELRFTESLKTWFKRNKELSERQQECLFGIYKAIKNGNE